MYEHSDPELKKEDDSKVSNEIFKIQHEEMRAKKVLDEPIVEASDEEENEFQTFNIPTFNKFTDLTKLENENFRAKSSVIESKEPDALLCQVCDNALKSESSLNDHSNINHKENSDSSTQTSSVKSISRFQQTQELKHQEKFNSF